MILLGYFYTFFFELFIYDIYYTIYKTIFSKLLDLVFCYPLLFLYVLLELVRLSIKESQL